MEYAIDGEIEFIQVPHLRSVQKFVHKRIAQWVGEWRALQGGSLNDLTAFFYVKFEKIGTGHQIFCTIQLIIGKRMWKGTAIASGLHRALIYSMGHLNVRFERPVVELAALSEDGDVMLPEQEVNGHLRLVR